MIENKQDSCALVTGELTITLDRNVPMIQALSYGDKHLDMTLGPLAYEVHLYDPESDTMYSNLDGSLDVRISPAIEAGSKATYKVDVLKDGEEAAGFDLFFTGREGRLVFGFENVEEKTRLEFASFVTKKLIQISSEQEGARMLISANGGRLVDPQRCEPGDHFHCYSWVEDSFNQVAAVYSQDLLAILRIPSLDDMMYSYVEEQEGRTAAGMGIRLTHKYTRQDPSYLRRPEKKEKGIGDLGVTSFLVSDHSSVEIMVKPRKYAEPHRGWIQAAEILRQDLPAKLVPFYQDTFINKIFMGSPSDDEFMTFHDVDKLLKKIHKRTGGARQIAFLVGFQHKGHDTGYPDVFTVNERAGGYDELIKLIEQGKEYDALVSFHDNFDDAYESSPEWDPDDIGVDYNGNLLKGGVWNDEQAYWISESAYAATKSEKRINRTLETYPIKDAYHLDVLTASVFRVDFRKDSPADRDADLKARLEIVKQFDRKGVDLSSEACGLPFLGGIAFFWHLVRMPREVYKGDSRIPFTAFLAHGRAEYGGCIADTNRVLDNLLYGAFWTDDLKNSTDMKEVLDNYFLINAPLNKLRGREMVDYSQWGGWKRVDYGGNSFVEVNFESQQYTAVVDGIQLVKDGVAVLPNSDDESCLIYKSSDSEVDEHRWELPEFWKGAEKIQAVPQTDEGDGEPMEIKVEDGKIFIETKPGMAYRCKAVK